MKDNDGVKGQPLLFLWIRSLMCVEQEDECMTANAKKEKERGGSCVAGSTTRDEHQNPVLGPESAFK